MKKITILLLLFAFAGLITSNLSATENVSWSGGKNYAAENAAKHWQKHKEEFPEFKNANEYIAFANEFVKNPPVGTLTKQETDGDILYYNKKMNIFAVKSAKGPPRTMFRPNAGIDYWNRK